MLEKKLLKGLFGEKGIFINSKEDGLNQDLFERFVGPENFNIIKYYIFRTNSYKYAKIKDIYFNFHDTFINIMILLGVGESVEEKEVDFYIDINRKHIIQHMEILRT